jgi:hypothetical protein
LGRFASIETAILAPQWDAGWSCKGRVMADR